MVRGLDLFRQRLRDFEGSMILIGGAACDDWFTSRGLPFRATRDLDIVLIIEMLAPAAMKALRAFIADGGYEIRQQTTGTPVLYRFSKPTKAEFPFMLELFSRRPDGLDLAAGQEITPIPAGADHHSLSAILVDDDYYSLIQTHQTVRDGLRFATATSLIALKARAWLDLTKRLAEGQQIDSKDIAKHRNDVFRLAGTLPGEPGPQLSDVITDDLGRFLRSFPEDSPEWESILTSLKNTLGGAIRPVSLRTAIQTFFRLPAD